MQDEDVPTPLPGFLVASRPAPSGDLPEGDGPPSSSDSEEEEADPGDTWSCSGGSRQGSFRKVSDEKAARAQKIRSDVLTSHLVTPQIHGRSINPSFIARLPGAPPAEAEEADAGSFKSKEPSTIGFTPRKLGSSSEAPDSGASNFRRSSAGGRKLNNLAKLTGDMKL